MYNTGVNSLSTKFSASSPCSLFLRPKILRQAMTTLRVGLGHGLPCTLNQPRLVTRQLCRRLIPQSPLAGPSRPLHTKPPPLHHLIRHPPRSAFISTVLRPSPCPTSQSPISSLHLRSNSTTTTAPSINTKPPIPPTNHPDASSAPSTSILARLTSLVSLSPVEASHPPSAAGHGSSSVAKLVELAKPEARQLSMAVGLAGLPSFSCYRGADGEQLLVSSSVSMLVPLTIGKLIDFFSTGAVHLLSQVL